MMIRYSEDGGSTFMQISEEERNRRNAEYKAKIIREVDKHSSDLAKEPKRTSKEQIQKYYEEAKSAVESSAIRGMHIISGKSKASCYLLALQWDINDIEYRCFKHKHKMEMFLERFRVSRKWIGPYMPARILFKVNVFLKD